MVHLSEGNHRPQTGEGTPIGVKKVAQMQLKAAQNSEVQAYPSVQSARSVVGKSRKLPELKRTRSHKQTDSRIARTVSTVFSFQKFRTQCSWTCQNNS